MAWYKWALIAAGVFVGARLLKAVPRQYEEVAALCAFLAVFVAIPLLMRKARSSAESASAENQVTAQDLLNDSGEYSLYLKRTSICNYRTTKWACRESLSSFFVLAIDWIFKKDIHL